MKEITITVDEHGRLSLKANVDVPTLVYLLAKAQAKALEDRQEQRSGILVPTPVVNGPLRQA